MSHKEGTTFVVQEEPKATCEMCGKLEELRPYGPGGMNVCFACAMEDEEEAKRQFLKRIEGCDGMEQRPRGN